MQSKKKAVRPRQKQRGNRASKKRKPRPEAWTKNSPHELKLAGRGAIISGGDSGIGRAVALAFAAEGADVAILYSNEHRDAKGSDVVMGGKLSLIVHRWLGFTEISARSREPGCHLMTLRR